MITWRFYRIVFPLIHPVSSTFILRLAKDPWKWLATKSQGIPSSFWYKISDARLQYTPSVWNQAIAHVFPDWTPNGTVSILRREAVRIRCTYMYKQLRIQYIRAEIYIAIYIICIYIYMFFFRKQLQTKLLYNWDVAIKYCAADGWRYICKYVYMYVYILNMCIYICKYVCMCSK